MSEYIFLKQKKKTMFYLQRHRISFIVLSFPLCRHSKCVHAHDIHYVCVPPFLLLLWKLILRKASNQMADEEFSTANTAECFSFSF